MRSTSSRPRRSKRRSAASPAIRRPRGRPIRTPNGTAASGASATTACRPASSCRTKRAGARACGCRAPTSTWPSRATATRRRASRWWWSRWSRWPGCGCASRRSPTSPTSAGAPTRRRTSTTWRAWPFSTPIARRRSSWRIGTRTRRTNRPAPTNRPPSPASGSTTCRRRTTGASTRTCTIRGSSCCCRVRSPPASGSCWSWPTRRSWSSACATPPATC